MNAIRALLVVAACGCSDVRPLPTEPVADPSSLTTTAALPVAPPAALQDAVGQPVSIEARDLVLLLGGAEVRVPYLSGHLVPRAGGQMVDLETPESYEVFLDALELRIPEQTLRHAMAAGPRGKAAFRDLVVGTEGGALLLDGHTGPLNLPFSFRAEPSVTRGGGLGLHLEKLRVLGIGVKGFLAAFHEGIEDSANRQGHLIDIDGDWLVIQPFPFAGGLTIHAAFTSVEVRDHDLVARLGELTEREEGKEPGGLTLSGGVLRSQKAVYFGATLRLVAQDGGALVIDPATLGAQLAGGFARVAKDGNFTLFVLAPGERPIQAVVTPAAGPAAVKTPPEHDLPPHTSP